jgi:hypothetical protein
MIPAQELLVRPVTATRHANRGPRRDSNGEGRRWKARRACDTNRAMKRWLVTAVVLLLSSCSGAPPGFSSGESWSLPLVGPLENGVLITPVFMDDKGPYLFAIDPDAPQSTVDEGVVSEIKPYGFLSQRYDDEQDTSHVMHVAEVTQLRVGNLTVTHHDYWVQPIGTFDIAGRHIRGVIGHDIIADSLIFGFDRDKGVAFLATRKGFVPPAGAAVTGYRILTSHLGGPNIEMQPSGRRLVDANVNGKSAQMHIDLGAVRNQLRDNQFGAAKLTRVPLKDDLVDEIGVRRTVDHGGVADTVQVGGLTGRAQVFVPYDDRRWEVEDIDGTLGLGFFNDFAVTMDLDQQKLYTMVRPVDLAGGTKERIDRWSSQQLSSCTHPGCFDISMLPAEAPSQAAPGETTTAQQPHGPLAHFQRDPQAKDLNIEVTLMAVGKDGKALSLPLMVASFPAGEDTMTAELDPAIGDATLVVIDASPFTRDCPEKGKPCLYNLGGS